MFNRIKNKNGFTSVYAIGFLILVTFGGMAMIFHARRDKVNSDSYLKIKSSYQAAMFSLQACEGKFENRAVKAYDLLAQYTDDNSYEWLLNSKDNANDEETYNMWEGDNACKYSARIIGFDPLNFLIKIEGRGYGRYGGMKKAVATYQLKGLGNISSNGTGYALYIKKDGYDFNQYIKINGDVYFGGGFRFNSNATGTVIDGNFKTGKSNFISEFNGGITVTKNAFFQTPIQLQNASLTVEGNAGFDEYVKLFKNMYLKNDAFFNDNVYENSKINMNGKKVLHSGSCSNSKFINYSTFESNGSKIDIPSKMEITSGEYDPATTVNIDDIPSSYIKNFNTLGFVEFTGINLQKAYANTPASEKWKGYLVVRISNSDTTPTFYKKEGLFKGKAILIIEKELSVNENWYSSCNSSETLLYVTNGGVLYQLGWDNLLRAYINVTGSGLIHYSFNVGSSLKGAIHHVSDNAGFQANSSNLFQLIYDENLMNSLKTANLINDPASPDDSSVTFKLIDAKIRPQLLSVQQI